jgi:hypothetical protein
MTNAQQELRDHFIRSWEARALDLGDLAHSRAALQEIRAMQKRLQVIIRQAADKLYGNTTPPAGSFEPVQVGSRWRLRQYVADGPNILHDGAVFRSKRRAQEWADRLNQAAGL